MGHGEGAMKTTGADRGTEVGITSGMKDITEVEEEGVGEDGGEEEKKDLEVGEETGMPREGNLIK